MSARSADSATKAVAGVLLAVVLINVLPRVVGLPDLDLPDVDLPSLPDLPAWADTGVDVVHTVVKAKNWLVAGVIAVVIAGALIDQRAKRRTG